MCCSTSANMDVGMDERTPRVNVSHWCRYKPAILEVAKRVNLCPKLIENALSDALLMSSFQKMHSKNALKNRALRGFFCVTLFKSAHWFPDSCQKACQVQFTLATRHTHNLYHKCSCPVSNQNARHFCQKLREQELCLHYHRYAGLPRVSLNITKTNSQQTQQTNKMCALRSKVVSTTKKQNNKNELEGNKQPHTHTHTHTHTVHEWGAVSTARCFVVRQAVLRVVMILHHHCRCLPPPSTSSSQLLLACARAVRTLCTEVPPKALCPYQEEQEEIPSDHFHPPHCPDHRQRCHCSSIRSNVSVHPQKKQFEATHRMSFCLETVTHKGLFLFERQLQKVTFLSVTQKNLLLFQGYSQNFWKITESPTERWFCFNVTHRKTIYFKVTNRKSQLLQSTEDFFEKLPTEEQKRLGATYIWNKAFCLRTMLCLFVQTYRGFRSKPFLSKTNPAGWPRRLALVWATPREEVDVIGVQQF